MPAEITGTPQKITLLPNSMTAPANPPRKTRILFLCMGNSCRSKMAEAWTRALHGDRIEAWSAGAEAHGLDPCTLKVMAEAGVNMAGQRSKRVDELPDLQFDYAITLCGGQGQQCPVFPRQAILFHAAFDDPPRLSAGARTEEERLAPYRRVRDEIRQFVQNLPRLLHHPPSQ